MQKARRMKQFIALLLVVVMAVTPVSGIQAQAESDNSAGRETVFTGDRFEVVFKVTGQWSGAFNAEITLKNTSDHPIENWALQFSMAHEINDIWNAVVSSNENGNYIVKNAVSNQDIVPGKSVSFGFSAVCGQKTQIPDAFEVLSSEKEVDVENYEISFQVTDDWESAFNGEIRIKNISNETIEDWKLQFDFDTGITQFWTAEITEHTENHYYINNAGYNSDIKSGETLVLEFSGNPGNLEKEPQNYQLNQVVTDNLTYIDLPDGKIEKDYLYRVIYTNLLLKGLPTDNVLLSDDYDGDGLTLGQEYEYDTNPFSADSDEDGLEDYSEIKLHHTDPNKWDTDEDGMGDGTEEHSGLNPLTPDTDGDGVPDSEEIITQDVGIEAVNKIDIKETLVKPQVEITGKGDYSSRLYAEDINNNTALSELEYMVGHPFDFVHEDGLEFENSKLTFSVDESALQDNNLEDLAIAGYDTESNEVRILDTEYDTVNNTVCANVDHYSIYFVLNLNAYLETVLAENTAGMKDGKADIVFLVNTAFYMSETMDNIRANLPQFIDELQENNVDARLGLVEFGGFYTSVPEEVRDYNWFPDGDSCKNAVSSLRAHGIYEGYDGIGFDDAVKNIKSMDFRPDAGKYVIMITDAEIILSSADQKMYELSEEKGFRSLTASGNLSGQSGKVTILSDDEIPLQPSDGICFSAITQFTGYSPYESLVYETNGVNGNVRSNFATTLNSLIYGTGGSESGGYYVNLSNGFTVRLDNDPSLGDDSVDTDGDDIPDVIELGEFKTVTIQIPFTELSFDYEYWTFSSNPASADTDGDGIADVDDLNPSVFDTVILESTDDLIRFNTGRTWRNISCTSFDYLDNLFVFIDNVVDNPIPLEEFRIIVDNNSKNWEQNFNIDELTVIGLVNNEGSKLYMTDKPDYTRETVFTKLAGRESKDFKHSGILWWSD